MYIIIFSALPDLAPENHVQLYLYRDLRAEICSIKGNGPWNLQELAVSIEVFVASDIDGDKMSYKVLVS